MKHYVKPELKYEKFQLSQHIADCGWELNSSDANSCSATGDSGWGYPTDINAFVNGNQACEKEPEDYCYTNGSSGVGLYRS